jgi:hypothetical protein
VQPSRRQVLSGTVVALSAACTSHRADRPAPPDPDVALTADAVAREQALLDAYDAALGADPSLVAELGPYRADHAAHLAALRPSAAASPTPTAPGPVPGQAARTRAGLAAAERAAAAAHATATTTASPRLAGLLASLAASEASHATLL